MAPVKWSISAFFPAYNDAATIGKLVHKAATLLPTLTQDYEIVVVDDGSVDGTGELLNTLAARYPMLKVIHHGVNRGYGAALITGFANCTKDLIFYTDGDGQYDVGEIEGLLGAFTDTTDIVNGYKIRRSDPSHRVVIGFVYQRLMKLLFGLAVRDVDCDFRLFRRSLLDRIELTCDSGVICVEMMKKFQAAGCRMQEVPVHHYHRSSGTSQFFCFHHLRNVFLQLFSEWWKLVVRRRLLRPAMGRPMSQLSRAGFLPED